MSKTLSAAIVQAAPIPLCIDRGVEQVVGLVKEAAQNGAKLIAFGETFVGGYPIWLDEASDAALWDHPGTKALHAILMDQSIVENDRRLTPLQELVDEKDLIISVGVHERIRSSLYNNQMVFRAGENPLNHRKLVPTHGERLIWNRGDGSTIDVHQSSYGNIGNLICWEHWMPLVRAAMHNLEEVAHIAAWPTVRETYGIASRHYAFEGGCFVLAAGTLLHQKDLVRGLEAVGGSSDALDLISQIPDRQLQFGGSIVVGPDGLIISEANDDDKILFAELDIAKAEEAKAALDTDGHYSRPDIFELTVNKRASHGVVWEDDLPA